MRTYRNKKNGATFTTPCVCAGEDWEEVSVPPPKAGSVKKKSKAAETELPDEEKKLPDDGEDS